MRNKIANLMMKILNVAEKNDAAKNLANIMSRGTSVRKEGYSKYNKIYEFDYEIPRLGRCQMIMTSVSGHLFNYDFTGTHRQWNGCDPSSLFNAPVTKTCQPDQMKIKQTLEREARKSSHLIIWTDCDREGENIGFEIIQVCREANRSIQVHRARFSEITNQAVQRAINNLVEPDKKVSDAVDVRQELDLRIGAAFTRFQTMRLQRIPELSQMLISYGSCQFPTLGFVVERYKQRINFVPESFWLIEVKHTKNGLTASFNWSRHRLFDERACLGFLERILRKPQANVLKVDSKRTSRWRPEPMDTVALEKLASNKLKISAKRAMDAAEKLYTKGFISYPRTETTIFPPDINLANYVQMQTQNRIWGQFAQKVLENGPNPRQGKKTDKAHPPIHPTKYADNLSGDEAMVYELVVRHFLACLSKDAVGNQTSIEISINEELFHLNGLIILERNFLEIYIYESWNNKEIPEFRPGECFTPDSIMMAEGKTTAPQLLTEAELIALMEKNGIGTDATHAEHIEKIKSRNYIQETTDRRLAPCELGIGLVDGYDEMGYEMSKPFLRAALETDLQGISNGNKDSKQVLQQQISQYERVFVESVRNVNKLTNSVEKYLNEKISLPNLVKTNRTNTNNTNTNRTNKENRTQNNNRTKRTNKRN